MSNFSHKHKTFYTFEAKITRSTKRWVCSLWFFNGFKAFMVSLFCLPISGIFSIFLTVKYILQIKIHTHNFCFRYFDQSFSIKPYLTYYHHNCLKSDIFWYHNYEQMFLKKIQSNSSKGKRQVCKICSCICIAKICGGYVVPF